VKDASADPCSPAAFERRYRSDADPWEFASSPYERAKYEVTVASLSRTHYPQAWEPGCSIGELTAGLAPRCGTLLATDVAPTAVAQARKRCAAFANVRIECADVLNVPRHHLWDLIVLSEIGYYFNAETLADLAWQVSGALDSGGEIVAVHWLGESDDHALHGDEVHEVLRANLLMPQLLSQSHAGYRLDSWRKR
jgi:cyclopropane fatty-acyl-phospholipid synthase-like methyltransferase